MTDERSSTSYNKHSEHPADDGDAEKLLAEALASLQLPRMPSSRGSRGGAEGGQQQQPEDRLPTVTILVCADIDLASTSALSEYLLMDLPHIAVDLIIAAGPCTRDEDLMTSCQGSAQRGKYKRRQQQHQQQFAVHHHQQSPYSSASKEASGNHGGCTGIMTPFYRSREESAALEGLMTAALSQLESIVCRVLYCPGLTDPLTVILEQQHPKRLTPNARNLHRQWLPLVPGLGCAGLFYLDGTEHVLAQFHSTAASAYNDDDDDSEASDEEGENTAMLLTEQVKKMQQSPPGYIPTLSKLLQLAPEAEKHNPQHTGKAQSILVTHYVDGRKLVRQDEEDSIFRPDYNGDLDDLFHAADPHGLAAAAVVVSPGGGDDDENDTKCSSSASVPWPVDHREFLRDASTSRLLCLEIASGSAASHPAAWISSSSNNKQSTSRNGSQGSVVKNSNGPVLLPGSLRERGEFSILTVALVEQRDKTDQQQRFAWEVQSVDIHYLGNFD